MFAFFTMLLAKIAAVVGWFGDLFVQVFKDLWEIFTDIPCWIFDQVLKVAAEALQAVDVHAFDPYMQTWGEAPAQLLNALAYLRIGQAVAIITAAILLRLLLQLIPFTRLGS